MLKIATNHNGQIFMKKKDNKKLFIYLTPKQQKDCYDMQPSMRLITLHGCAKRTQWVWINYVPHKSYFKCVLIRKRLLRNDQILMQIFCWVFLPGLFFTQSWHTKRNFEAIIFDALGPTSNGLKIFFRVCIEVTI